jgi:dolichyl-phosphate beta-glucosyltransferase
MNSELRLKTRSARKKTRGDLKSFGATEPESNRLEKVSIVIPAYNEAKRLPESMRALLDEVPGSQECEIVIVDDGSSDDTCEVARAALEPFARARLLSLPRHHGKGAALRSGIGSCTGESVVLMDADMASNPSWINNAVALLDSLGGDCGMVIGSRAHPDSKIGAHPIHRTMAGKIFNALTRSISGLDTKDTQCGSKALRGSLAALVSTLCSVEGFAFDVEAILLTKALGYQVEELAVEWHHVGGSHVNWLQDPLVMTMEVAKAKRRVRPDRPLSVLEVRWSSTNIAVSQAAAQESLDDLLKQQLRAGTLVVSTAEAALIVQACSSRVSHREELSRVRERLSRTAKDLRLEPRTLSLANLGQWARRGHAWLVPSRFERDLRGDLVSKSGARTSRGASTTTNSLAAC